MLNAIAFLTPAASFYFLRGPYWWATWQGKWAVLMFALAIYLSIAVAKRFHWSVALFLCIALCSGVNSFAWAFLSREASYATYSLLSLVFFFYALPHSAKATMQRFLAMVCFASSLATFWDRGGFVGNPSMNGCLIAVALPSLIAYTWDLWSARVLGVVLAVSAIFYIGQSIPVGTLAVTLGAVFYAFNRRVPWVGVALLFGIGYLTQGAEFFSSTGRFGSYRHVWEWWSHSNAIWYGTGTGTGQTIFREIAQKEWAFTMWAHSDYLQVLVENGAVGLAALLLMVFYTLKRSLDRPALFGSVAGFAAMALFNYPAHLPIHAFIGVALVWATHVRRG